MYLTSNPGFFSSNALIDFAIVLEMNQDQTVICFFAWSSALLAERKSALVSRKASVVRLFIEYLFMIPTIAFVIIEFSRLSE